MAPKKTFFQRLIFDLNRYKYLYIFFALPVVIYYVVFKYVPLYGLQIAFKDYKITKEFWECAWVGFKHFEKFFTGMYFTRTVGNTLIISFLNLIFGFPAPIVFALLLNEVQNQKFKKVVQTVTYLPHFVSLVVICGLIVSFSAKDGLFNTIIAWFGGTKNDLLMSKAAFRPIYILSGIWAGFGWGSIIYLSALAGVDQEQYEAAYIDGAKRFQRMIYITLPGILPTIVIKLIMEIGSMMSVGSEKILLLYSPLTYEVADVVSTYVYRKGLEDNDYSYSTAVGLFNSVINIILLTFANTVSRRLTDTSLW
ncbi:MAG: sugar ABC transporter permease [Firmicutes bacterium]|nr:sugar ABC transporter permease [Bacillota bacterium]